MHDFVTVTKQLSQDNPTNHVQINKTRSCIYIFRNTFNWKRKKYVLMGTYSIVYMAGVTEGLRDESRQQRVLQILAAQIPALDVSLPLGFQFI